MATLVGTQTKFLDTLQDLTELEFDALEAYESSIKRLGNRAYKDKLIAFKKDHERHITELKEILSNHGCSPPKGPSGKQWLTKGKIVLADLIGDKSILKAMATNEADMVKAYEKMLGRKDKWTEAEETLARGLSDEKRHKAWMDEHAHASN